MLEIVRRTIMEYQMIETGEKVLVAVSGGPDSIALLHCLHRLAGNMGFSLHVVHINHGVRPESAEEAEFVQRFAGSLGIGVTVRELDGKSLKNGSFQELAREARKKIFTEVSLSIGASKVALGHNANDQAETVLQRLLRGGGTGGLGGIYPKREEIIRPLLFIPRKQIEEYLRQEQLEYRIDSSNYRPVYLRNKIRLELLPFLEREYNPRLVETLGKTAAILQEENSFLDEETARQVSQLATPLGNGYLLPNCAFILPGVLVKRIVRQLFARLSGDPRGLEYDHVNRVIQFAREGSSGGQLELPKGVRVYKEQEGMLFCSNSLKWPSIERQSLNIPGETKVHSLGMTVRARIVDNPAYFPLPEGAWSVVFDYDQLQLPLVLRGRTPGDRVSLKGHQRKLKDIFIERKIPLRVRETCLVIVQGEEVLWVPGVIRCDKAKVLPATRKVLELTVVKN